MSGPVMLSQNNPIPSWISSLCSRQHSDDCLSVCLFVCEYQAAIALRDSDCKKDVFPSQQGPPISHICTDHSSFGPGLALGLGPAGQSGPTVNKANKNTAIEHKIEKESMWKGLVGI